MTSTTHLFNSIARAIAPRVPLTVSQWADAKRILSPKTSPLAGNWRTSFNPLLREPMDCLSVRSPVHDVVLMFPIQIGKSEVGTNFVGYIMDHAPGPTMVCLPGEVAQHKWITQKLNPLIEETPAVRDALTSIASRESANQKDYKEFKGGMLYVEHAGSPQRLKSNTVKNLIVDEYDEFALNLRGGDDPVSMLEGRHTAFRATYKELDISSPGISGVSRIEAKWEKSDKRQFYVACPDCGHAQPLIWHGLQWNEGCTDCWYVCRECGVVIREHQKTQMIAEADRRALAGEQGIGWVPENPESNIRGYHTNALYYPIGLGLRWLDLAHKWLEAQGDNAKLKTFVNDRLGEPWNDPTVQRVKHNIIVDRAEPYPLRHAPAPVLAVTAGVDTQDDRLEVQILGWGRRLDCWTLDYVRLPGDPFEDEVWIALTELLNRPIEHASGGQLIVEATAIDGAGHRTEAVKDFVRRRLIRRPMVIFGAVPNNAPVLSKGKLQDINWRGRYDKRGVHIHHVGTVGIKHMLYARLSSDADKAPDQRTMHFSDELEPDYFGGLVSEIYNPVKNRFEKRRGAPRNEPLDTWVYGYAATHHPELRLNRLRAADWDAREARLAQRAAPAEKPPATAPAAPATPVVTRGTSAPPGGGFGGADWSKRGFR